jgi:hypothetical protein
MSKMAKLKSILWILMSCLLLWGAPAVAEDETLKGHCQNEGCQDLARIWTGAIGAVGALVLPHYLQAEPFNTEESFASFGVGDSRAGEIQMKLNSKIQSDSRLSLDTQMSVQIFGKTDPGHLFYSIGPGLDGRIDDDRKYHLVLAPLLEIYENETRTQVGVLAQGFVYQRWTDRHRGFLTSRWIVSPRSAFRFGLGEEYKYSPQYGPMFLEIAYEQNLAIEKSFWMLSAGGRF